MVLLAFLEGESLALMLQGIFAGAFLAVVSGFAWGGWILGSTAIQQADEQSSIAVVSVLAPICVEKLKSYKGSAANFAELNQQSSCKRIQYVENGGWAILPRSDSAGLASPQHAHACLPTCNKQRFQHV